MLDDEEPQLSAHEVALHLSQCPACSAWLDQAMTMRRNLLALPIVQPQLGESMVNGVDVRLCGCHTGGACTCHDCHCGPSCICHRAPTTY